MKNLIFKKKVITAGFLLLCSNLSFAACEDVINLSKLTNRTVREKNDFEQQARNFCNAEGQTRSRAGSTGGSLGYGGLELSGSQQNSSFESSYANTCAADNSGGVRSDAYFNYVESIAPGAFQAYSRCLELQNKTGVVFSINSVTPRMLTIGVFNRTTMGNASPQTVTFNAPEDVSCKWNKGRNTKEFTIGGNNTASLVCTRTNATSRTFVEMYVETSSQEAISFSWSAYQGDVKVDTIQALEKRLTFFENALSKGVVAFAAKECPAGWKMYEPAFGAFIRGIDKGKKSIDPDGERTPGHFQPHAYAEHTHAFNPPKIIIDSFAPIGDEKNTNTPAAKGGDYTFSSVKGITTSSGSGKETRPANVALLYCIRQ